MIRSTFAGFTTAQLGMSASQAALNVIGQNISNVNTKGFTRQRVDLDSFNVTTGPRQWGSVNETFIGNGVVVNRVEQVRDPYLDLRFRTEMAGVGYYDKTLASLEDLQSVLDEVEKEGSIHNQLEAVFKALNEFNPQAANNEFQNMAKTELLLLSQYFNTYSNRIEQAKTDNMTEFKEQTIPAINQLLKDITSLNVSINENEILGNPALELRDERNLLLDELSNYVKIEVTYEDEYVGLSNKTAAECTVKMVGVDEKGNPFKYTLIDHDKAAEFQIDDDCSHLTMTDVNGNPIADIGSALKPNAAGTQFTQAEADAINGLLEDIQFFTNAMIKEMQNIEKLNNDINAYGSRIVSLSRRGNELHEELNDILKSVRENDRAIATTQDQLANATPGSDEEKKLTEKLANLRRIETIYNQKLYGQDTKPADINTINDAGSASDGTGIYNKLINIFGKIQDADTQPPTYFDPPQGGEMATVKANLEQAKTDLAAAKENYAKIVHNLNVAQKGDQYKDGKYADGAYETITDPSTGAVYTPKANATTQQKGLTGHANVVIEEETFPVEGTKFFIKLPNIKLGGTSAKDGNGIPLFDADTKKIANFTVNAAGDEITITDTKGATYTEEVADVDGSPYELDANGNIVLDENGKPVLNMGDQTNMYEKMQEDNGSIKAALDMFNRAGDFDGTKDRGYDYYLNMLDVFARQIAKVFNEANMKDNDGNPLLDSNGKPISYANALFGADGQVPVKNATTPDGKNYLSYGGVTATADNPLPDIFKTDANGQFLDATGAVVNIPNGTTNVPNNVALDASALAAYGIVKYTGEAHTIKDAAGNDVTVNPGDWVDKEGKPLQLADGSNVTKLETLQDLQDSTILDQADPLLNQIANGDLKPLDGKVPKIDYDKITAANFTITKDWADNKTNFVQTHDPSQTAGYNDNINHLISVFGQKLNYTFTQPDGTQKQIFNGTFVEFYDNVGNQLGLDIKSSTVLITNYITIANDIANNRDAISGVSLDEEGIDIMKYQKAYAASARVMTALDEALEKVINGMGVVGR
ncbi:flagellar basal body rod C-terminal domain-containing protein [Lachnospiraceae bacterium 46-61]